MVWEYLQKNNNVEVLDLLSNGITKLGCEFISRIISPNNDNRIESLKLDHNSFGAAGMKELAKGLNQNRVITELSLTYCNIDEDGARPLFDIVIFRGSSLEKLHLSGNHLRDKGIIVLLRGLSCAKTLEYINIADN